jgi:predicted Zn-dependent protease
MMLGRDPAGAIKSADAALAEDPDCGLALRVKARGQVALQSPEGLEDLGDRLLRLAPERGWGALAHGARHILGGSIREASPWLRQAEADSDPATLLTLATLWMAGGRVANAARVFAKVLELEPGDVTAEIGLAMAATARRDFMAAEAGLHRARKVEPGRPAVWLQLAQVYARSGRKAEAARMADAARRLGAAPALATAAAAGRLRV